MNPYYLEVAFRAYERCEYCKAPEIVSNFLFEVEHIVPRFHNGTDDFENLALACRSCNVFKSNFLKGIDENGVELDRLFNPRIDNWSEHFRLNIETLKIEGLTEIGIGTINRLKMNSSKQIGSRRIWVRYNSYP